MERNLTDNLTSSPQLPVLREELSIASSGAALDGAPTWLIHDPVRNRYFRISRKMFQLLGLWRISDLETFTDICSSSLNRNVETSEVDELVTFLFRNSLTVAQPGGNSDELYKQYRASRQGVAKLLLHRYLFFRIPLARPQPFLNFTWPMIAPLFTRTAVRILIILTGFGLYLVSRQWDVFVSTFLGFFTTTGLIYYGFSLILVKIFHELGHAYMATKYGFNVPTIGVAFLVLFPVLYTDTSDTWRSTSRKQRLNVDLAGIYTELALAGICTLVWVFLPDGPMRSIVFTTATVSWVFSLLVNLNPFMRFDGYYVLSDFLGVENLQERGFELGRWKLREMLFKTGKLVPEALDPLRHKVLIIYAFGTWIYRFFLFIGIALLIYLFFIKVVAVILCVVEIVWFIAGPVWREMKVWWLMRNDIFATSRSKFSLVLILILLGFFCFPWATRVDVPAVLAPQENITLFASAPGMVSNLSLVNGQRVQKGQFLGKLSSPDISNELLLTGKRIKLLQLRLRRIAADPHRTGNRTKIGRAHV